ncbi:MAG: exodeoxyribonuclease VII small subunit [Kineosporiaceae bacterium]
MTRTAATPPDADTPAQAADQPHAAEQDELPPDVAAMSYEAARDELTDLVRRLEAGSAPLEESLALWERGELLARRCEQVLDGALARLDAARPGTAG